MAVIFEVGGVFAGVSGVFAREILAIEGKDITYREFYLPDGKPLSSWRICTRTTFRRWAAHPCTEQEISRFRREEMPRFDALLIDVLSQVLSR